MGFLSGKTHQLQPSNFPRVFIIKHFRIVPNFIVNKKQSFCASSNIRGDQANKMLCSMITLEEFFHNKLTIYQGARKGRIRRNYSHRRSPNEEAILDILKKYSVKVKVHLQLAFNEILRVRIVGNKENYI